MTHFSTAENVLQLQWKTVGKKKKSLIITSPLYEVFLMHAAQSIFKCRKSLSETDFKEMCQRVLGSMRKASVLRFACVQCQYLFIPHDCLVNNIYCLENVKCLKEVQILG